MQREVKMPSGAILKVAPSEFSVSKALCQALLKEARGVELKSSTEMAELYRELFCIGFSSPEIEACLWECFKKCTYNDGKGDFRITADTFEPVAAREDYMSVCAEVAKENVLPFSKSLFAEFQRILATMEKSPESK